MAYTLFRTQFLHGVAGLVLPLSLVVMASGAIFTLGLYPPAAGAQGSGTENPGSTALPITSSSKPVQKSGSKKLIQIQNNSNFTKETLKTVSEESKTQAEAKRKTYLSEKDQATKEKEARAKEKAKKEAEEKLKKEEAEKKEKEKAAKAAEEAKQKAAAEAKAKENPYKTPIYSPRINPGYRNNLNIKGQDYATMNKNRKVQQQQGQRYSR